jgi:hypothetical protein
VLTLLLLLPVAGAAFIAADQRDQARAGAQEQARLATSRQLAAEATVNLQAAPSARCWAARRLATFDLRLGGKVGCRGQRGQERAAPLALDNGMLLHVDVAAERKYPGIPIPSL